MLIAECYGLCTTTHGSSKLDYHTSQQQVTLHTYTIFQAAREHPSPNRTARFEQNKKRNFAHKSERRSTQDPLSTSDFFFFFFFFFKKKICKANPESVLGVFSLLFALIHTYQILRRPAIATKSEDRWLIHSGRLVESRLLHYMCCLAECRAQATHIQSQRPTTSFKQWNYWDGMRSNLRTSIPNFLHHHHHHHTHTRSVEGMRYGEIIGRYMNRKAENRWDGLCFTSRPHPKKQRFSPLFSGTYNT